MGTEKLIFTTWGNGDSFEKVNDFLTKSVVGICLNILSWTKIEDFFLTRIWQSRILKKFEDCKLKKQKMLSSRRGFVEKSFSGLECPE